MPLLALIAAPSAPVAAMPLPVTPDPLVSEFASRIPVGLQRGRSKGWKRPPHSASVGRGTMFANPFARPQFGHARSILMFEDWFEGSMSDLRLERHGFCPAEIDALHRLRCRVHDNLWRLHRKDLICSCPLTSNWCHRKTLIAGANEDLTPAQLFAAQEAHITAAIAASKKWKAR
jgi:hypothetical protein